MATQETVERVSDTFAQQEVLHGFTNAPAVVTALGVIPGNPSARHIERAIQNMPTREYLYEGAYATLATLLEQGDRVTIWTQGNFWGQQRKAANAGFGQLRKDLPFSERDRFSVTAQMDKITQLPNTLTQQAQYGQPIIIVDDKAKNILAVAEQIERWRHTHPEYEKLRIIPVWINQGRTKDAVPTGYTLESFTNQFQTIHDINELQLLREAIGEPSSWLVDLDHTLLNTGEAQKAMQHYVAGVIDGPFPIVSQTVDARIGLNGNVAHIRELKSGMSDGRVIHVLLTEQDDVVIKTNRKYPEKVSHEITGYRKLAGTPIATKMIAPLFSSEESRIIVLPHIPGKQLREGIKNGEIAADLALDTLSQLLEMKRTWWASQEQINPNGTLVSMQRDEWEDTLEKSSHVVTTLAETYGLSDEAILSFPIIVNGKQLPSLSTAFKKVAALLSEHPTYAVLAHNDATGANILVHPETRDWRLIDAEWVGQSDPAEAFVRMIKYISTTTATGDTKCHCC